MSKEADEALLKLVGVIAASAGMSLLRAATIVAFWRWYADRNRETGRRVLVRAAERDPRPA